MSKPNIKWERTKDILNYVIYLSLFVASIFFYWHTNDIQMLEESFVDVKIKLSEPPKYYKGKNPSIGFRAVGVVKEFKIRQGTLDYTRINSLTNNINKGDTISIKIHHYAYSEIDEESVINNFNEVYGFNHNNIEYIEYKKAIRADDNSNMLIFYLLIWVSLCCKIYKYFENEPVIDLTWGILIGCFLIFIYYRDVANNLNLNF